MAESLSINNATRQIAHEDILNNQCQESFKSYNIDNVFLFDRIFQLLITVVIQYFLMRDLEKLTGSLRIAIIYMGSGVAGNLASAIFVPYRADVSISTLHYNYIH